MIHTFLIVISAGVTLVCATRLMRAIRRYRYQPISQSAFMHVRELPSVTVCIPARNEMHALAQCLERVLATDYPKLEIIVLDDSSSDDTSVLIKSYASAGVRFIAGKVLPAGWIGKNHALQTLADEASGRYLIFLDVDTFISTTTISQLVQVTLNSDRDMISVIPERQDIWRSSTLFGTLRYFWALVLSGRKRPASSSALWLIDRQVLLSHGGFTKYMSTVRPENNLAGIAAAIGRHQAIIGSDVLGVSFEKKWLSQIETAQRLLYSLWGASWSGSIVGVLVMSCLVVPLAGSLLAACQMVPETSAKWYILLLASQIGMYGAYLQRAPRARGVFVRELAWPIIIVQELMLMALSIIRYATHTVTWKGRHVTAPSSNTSHLEIDE